MYIHRIFECRHWRYFYLRLFSINKSPFYGFLEEKPFNLGTKSENKLESMIKGNSYYFTFSFYLKIVPDRFLRIVLRSHSSVAVYDIPLHFQYLFGFSCMLKSSIRTRMFFLYVLSKRLWTFSLPFELKTSRYYMHLILYTECKDKLT